MLIPLLEIFFRIQRQLDHPLQQLLGRTAGEISVNHFLCKQATNITQLERSVSGGVDEVAMTVVDDDDVLLYVIFGPPQLAGRFRERVPGQSLLLLRRRLHLRQQ